MIRVPACASKSLQFSLALEAPLPNLLEQPGSLKCRKCFKRVRSKRWVAIDRPMWHKRGGFVCHIFGCICHIFCRNPLILTDFYAIRTPIVWHLWGHTFCKCGGGGGQNYFQPSSVSFLALTEFRGESSVSSSQPIAGVPKRAHRVFRRTHQVYCKTQ